MIYDLGTPTQAIEFALTLDLNSLPEFLNDWREGDISDWPEYADFLQGGVE